MADIEDSGIIRFVEILEKIPSEIKVDITEAIDIDLLIELIDEKKRVKFRSSSSYQNDIF